MIFGTSVGKTWWLGNWHYLKADFLTWLAASAGFSWDLIWGQWLEHPDIDSPCGCLSILTAWGLGPTASALWEPGSRWIIFHDLASEVTLGHGSPCYKPAQIKWRQHIPISQWEEYQGILGPKQVNTFFFPYVVKAGPLKSSFNNILGLHFMHVGNPP